MDSEDEDTVISLGGSAGALFDAEAPGERLVRRLWGPGAGSQEEPCMLYTQNGAGSGCVGLHCMWGSA